MAVTLTPELAKEYRTLFETCIIRPERKAAAETLVSKLADNRTRYEAVASPLGIPWQVVAVIHNMEASQNFKRHLHNGDPLSARTVQVPKGRPKSGQPPFTWEESAADALKYDGLHKWTDWSVAGVLFQLELFNGWGYRRYHPAVLTPYLWSFSPHYTKGKYASDGKWSPTLVSNQCGAAVLLRQMEAIGIGPF